MTRPIQLGLAANWQQFSLLVLVNGFVGAMLGLERTLLPLIASTGLTAAFPSEHAGADVSPMRPAGVPVAAMFTDGGRYFDIHHTDADTFDKIDPTELANGVGAMAVLAYVIADLPDRLDH